MIDCVFCVTEIKICRIMDVSGSIDSPCIIFCESCPFDLRLFVAAFVAISFTQKR